MGRDPFTDARAQIDDGLGLRVRPTMPSTYNMPPGGRTYGPPAMGAPAQPAQGVPAQPQGAANAGAGPLGQLGARYGVGPVGVGVNYQPGAGVGGNVQYSQGPFSAGMNYQPGAGMGGGLQYNQGPFSAGAGYDPRRGAYGDIAMRQNFARGGFAVK